MSKIKRVYICKECGNQTTSWYGICPNCHSYASLEEKEVKASELKKSKRTTKISHSSLSMPLSKVEFQDERRFSTTIEELDRVLGGGIVKGSLVLVGGEPGIGKSTLLLQVAHHISRQKKVLYFSGEESTQQIKLRAERLFDEDCDMYLCNSNELEQLESEIESYHPDFVIVDSIQTIFSSELDSIQGSVSQVKEVTARLMELAKKKQISIF